VGQFGVGFAVSVLLVWKRFAGGVGTGQMVHSCSEAEAETEAQSTKGADKRAARDEDSGKRDFERELRDLQGLSISRLFS